MSDGFIRLHWEVDSEGYDISSVVRADDSGRPGSSILEDAEEDAEEDAQWIVPRGGKLRTYKSTLLQHEIFKHLANAPRTPEGALAFVRKWGLPTRLPSPPLSYFYRARDDIRRAIEVGEHGGDTQLVRLIEEKRNGGLGKLEIKFQWNPRGDRERDQPQLYLVAHTLLQFCHLERLQALAGRIATTQCATCKKYLPIPREGRPRTYCGDACKQAAYNRRKRPSQRAVGA